MNSLGITIVVAAGFVVLFGVACHAYSGLIVGLTVDQRRDARLLGNSSFAIAGLLVLLAILVSREL